MSPRDRLIAELESPDHATAVPELAVRLKAEGMGQQEMMTLFSDVHQDMTGEEEFFDSLLDTMDNIWGGGWGRPDLFDTFGNDMER